MPEKSDVVSKCRAMIVEIKDPVELQRQLKEMLEAQFPVRKPSFYPGERMELHEFIERFQRNYCRNSAPVFYQWPVEVCVNNFGQLMITFNGSRAGLPPEADRALRESPQSLIPDEVA